MGVLKFCLSMMKQYTCRSHQQPVDPPVDAQTDKTIILGRAPIQERRIYGHTERPSEESSNTDNLIESTGVGDGTLGLLYDVAGEDVTGMSRASRPSKDGRDGRH